MTKPVPTLANVLPGYPALTLGTMLMPAEQTIATLHQAIALGYRAFDAAPIYGNEHAVGEALRTAPIPREELFVTTKLWNSSHRYDDALAAFDRTAGRLGLETVDLYLIHWPVPTRGHYVEAWKALVRLKEEGRVRAIGVSNFLPEHLDRIIDATGVVPAANQIEINPAHQQAALRAANHERGIVSQAWSPFGNGGSLADPDLAALAARLGCTPGQAVLRWHLQSGVHPVVKASSPAHMAENLAASTAPFDAADLAAMASFDRGASCFGLDPHTFEAPDGYEDYCP
jgi:diketogulonate reductase-like aldo/keto reductase